MTDNKNSMEQFFSRVNAAEKIEKLLVKIGETFICLAQFRNDGLSQCGNIHCDSIYVIFRRHHEYLNPLRT